MPLRKKPNNTIKGAKGEKLTQRMFCLDPVNGSGVGAFSGKGDSRNDWLQSDTKVTRFDKFSLNFKDFKKMRQDAAHNMRQFFLHVIQEEDLVTGEDSFVVITEGYAKVFNVRPVKESITIVESLAIPFPHGPRDPYMIKHIQYGNLVIMSALEYRALLEDTDG